MHYINGRKAREGDSVVYKSAYGDGKIRVGVVHSLRAEAQMCNCQVAFLVPGGVHYATATIGKELVHAEDAAANFDWGL